MECFCCTWIFLPVSISDSRQYPGTVHGEGTGWGEGGGWLGVGAERKKG